MLLVSFSVLAEDCEPKPWWKTAFPGSIETRRTSRPIVTPAYEEFENSDSGIDEEYGHPTEPAEPMVYHWDDIYLEPVETEVIIEPYGSPVDYDY